MNSIKYTALACGVGLTLLCAACRQGPDISEPTEIAREIPIVETVESTAANLMSETEPPIVSETETEPEVTYTTMYATTALNIRIQPEISEETYLTTVPLNTELTVLDYAAGHIWEVILFEDSIAYVATEFLSLDPVPVPVPEPIIQPIHYYGIWSGAYWHFTPEQIDNRWNGKKSGKPVLPAGTTQAWQQYLYQKLQEYQIEWFYPYAICQAMQESGMNPLNNVDRTQISWLHGQATYDCGLFSFKDIYWNTAYGDICDYHANINAYVDRITPRLQSNPNDINGAIAQHYDPYVYHQSYVDAVLSHMGELWICD